MKNNIVDVLQDLITETKYFFINKTLAYQDNAYCLIYFNLNLGNLPRLIMFIWCYNFFNSNFHIKYWICELITCKRPSKNA